MADETPASRPAQGREIMPPTEPIRVPPQSLGNQNWKLALAVLGSGLASVLGGAFSNYLQARGFVSVGAARIFLGISLLAGIVLIVVAVMAFAAKDRAVKIALGILVLLVFLGGFETWAIINGPKRIEAVTVDPQHFSFDGSLHKETYSLFVRENAGMEAYSVQVKMKFAQKSSSDFTFDTPSPKPIMEGSPLTDIQGLRCSDHSGHAVVMFWIYRMEPHSTREISITHNSDSTAAIDSNITYFTTKPVPRTGDRIHATGTFHFNEPLTCNGDIMFQLPTPPAPADSSPRPPPQQVTFFYIYPGLYFPTPGSNAERTSMVMYFGHHGPEDLFNLKVIMTDASRLLKHLPPTSEEIIQAKTYQSLPELDAAGFGAGGPAGFQWNLIDNDHAEFNFELSHRAGHLRELLKVRKIGDHWNKAIFLANFTSKDPLLACRDTEFPPDESFSAKLKPCERPTF